jgi:hypothetical protein
VIVQRGQLADLSQTLTRAVALIDGLESATQTVDIADHPGFLVVQPENDPQPVIERLASAPRLTFVVGAGASTPSGGLDLRPSRAGRSRHPQDDRHRCTSNSRGSGTDPSAPTAYNQCVTSPLASTNSHGIRVVADQAPLHQDVKTALAKGSRKATAGIDSLTKPRRRGTAATAKRTKRS